MPERKKNISIHRNFNTTFIILANGIFDSFQKGHVGFEDTTL